MKSRLSWWAGPRRFLSFVKNAFAVSWAMMNAFTGSRELSWYLEITFLCQECFWMLLMFFSFTESWVVVRVGHWRFSSFVRSFCQECFWCFLQSHELLSGLVIRDSPLLSDALVRCFCRVTNYRRMLCLLPRYPMFHFKDCADIWCWLCWSFMLQDLSAGCWCFKIYAGLALD